MQGRAEAHAQVPGWAQDVKATPAPLGSSGPPPTVFLLSHPSLVCRFISALWSQLGSEKLCDVGKGTRVLGEPTLLCALWLPLVLIAAVQYWCSPVRWVDVEAWFTQVRGSGAGSWRHAPLPSAVFSLQPGITAVTELL